MRCPRCAGNKNIMGLGFIEIECPICKGIGIVPDSIKPLIKKEEDIKALDSLVEGVKDVIEGKPKQRGRPAGAKNVKQAAHD